MKEPYLEVTYRLGKPQAAYLYLGQRAGETTARTVVTARGLVVDIASDGAIIGVEIPSPSMITLEAINEALSVVGHPPIDARSVPPLLAA